MSLLIHKRHNVTQLMYHLVFPTKHRVGVLVISVRKILQEICYKKIEVEYEIRFHKIGIETDHVHFLVQALPTYSISNLIKLIKSILTKELLKRMPELRRRLTNDELWSDGYFASTVGEYGDKKLISNYINLQNREKILYEQRVYNAAQRGVCSDKKV